MCSHRNPFLGVPIKGDDLLLKLLAARGDLGFLSSETTKTLEAVANKGDLRKSIHELGDIWPRILTDALFTLKKADKREYEEGKGLDARSLFDATSLGVQDLRKLLDSFREFEGMLYGASPEGYRDHVLHVFRAWMLGHLILEECLSWALFAEAEMPGPISETEWKCMWALASLCHDIGYPLAAIDKINRKARDALAVLGLLPLGDLRFGFSQQMLPFHDTVIKQMASKPVRLREGYCTHLQNKYYLKYLKSFDQLSHGIVSALLISKSLVYFLESDFSHDTRALLDAEDARQSLIRREVLRAIASHTCLDIYHLRFNTLSFVLYLVDEIQTWGRPTLRQVFASEDQEEQEATVEGFSEKSISIRIGVPDEAWRAVWTEGQNANWVRRKINDLHRILRLAVGTPTASGLHLEVVYSGKRNDDLSAAWFRLDKGRIEKHPDDWFKDEGTHD